MRFFFPDSVDQIDPDFDLVTEDYPKGRLRQRHDKYAHEIFESIPYDGILVSRAVVEGSGGGRYTLAQRHRLYRDGVRRFFRLPESLVSMGDCGAFNYVNETEPPFSVDEVLDFYDECRFDLGISVDHVILGYDASGGTVPNEWRRRYDLTLQLAADFLARHRARSSTTIPVGAAQGWDPTSYAQCVEGLQRIGYNRIALGGLVPLKTPEILDCLRAIANVRESSTQLHLLGVTRCDQVGLFAGFGVTSFDSTSPFRQSFKDSHDNYYVLDRTYVAIRVPQVDANASLKRRILAGEVNQRHAQEAERDSLVTLRAFDRREAGLDATLDAILRYAQLFDPKRDHAGDYRELLEARPWDECPCAVCRESGIDVMIFRGSERNKRRGFHNLHVFRQRLEREVSRASSNSSRERVRA
jgi:hypothetical protein